VLIRIGLQKVRTGGGLDRSLRCSCQTPSSFCRGPKPLPIGTHQESDQRHSSVHPRVCSSLFTQHVASVRMHAPNYPSQITLTETERQKPGALPADRTLPTRRWPRTSVAMCILARLQGGVECLYEKMILTSRKMTPSVRHVALFFFLTVPATRSVRRRQVPRLRARAHTMQACSSAP
jgi:hypothetical protein